MTKILRMVSLGATAAAFALAATPAAAQSASASASATINKPLTLTKTTDLAFGNILIVGSGTFSTNVVVSQAGSRTCDSAIVTCTGTAQAATYNTSGNKQRTVLISAPATVTLTNASSDNLVMAVSAPTSVVLLNSGAPGTNFGIGGTLTLTDATPDGAYSGTFNVTANYQ